MDMEQVGKSNWLEDKEKAGTAVTVKEVDELWQKAVQTVIEAEKLLSDDDTKDSYMVERTLSRLHADLWELRDAAWKAITDHL